MTVSSTTTKVSYTGNGSTSVFAYTFKIFADTEVNVWVDGVLKTLTTHYTVSGAGSASGGNITFTAGNIPANTKSVVFTRTIARTQVTDYVENDTFPAETHEAALDKLTLIAQEIDNVLSADIFRFAETVTDAGTVTIALDAATRASKLLAFDSSGGLVATQEIGSYKGNWATSTVYVERDLIKDTSNNNIYICLTGHTSSGTQPISSNTDVAKWALIVDAASASSSASAAASSATAAASSATAAASSASAASTSESNASTSASTASTQASNASTSATNAATSATNASTSETNTANITGAIAWKYTFDNSTTMGDPASGNVRLNNATLGSVTNIAFDAQTAESNDISDLIASIDDGTNNSHEGFITIRKSGAPSTFAVYAVTGSVTDNTSWLQVPVTHIASGGTLSNADTLYIGMTRSGNLGATGPTGATGATGPQGPAGDVDSVLTTQGDILYRGASTSARLGAGTSGQFLKTQGAGANPTWASVDTDLVNDTTPQLGGNLNLNSNDITGTGGIPAGNLTGTIAGARLPDPLPAVSGASLTNLPSDITKQTSDPTVSSPATPTLGDLILNKNTGELFCCTTVSSGANVWTNVGDGTGSIAPYTGMVATGGTITTDGDYKVHTFNSSGTFEVTTVGDDPELDYLVIAGGAGGGGGYGGGGGAGGYRNSYSTEASGGGGSSETAVTATATTYTVTIGAGGAGVTGWGATGGQGNAGGDSVFGSITSTGGGGGGYYLNPGPRDGSTGGSGGGGGACESNQGSGGSGTTNQGYDGGGANGNPGSPYGGGGGGGAGAVGGSATYGTSGDGGNGQASTITGSSVTRAGGGGGGGSSVTDSAGGSGGGGVGGIGTTRNGGDGTVNTGSGGGGVAGGSGGAGGSGVVIIRYKFQ